MHESEGEVITILKYPLNTDERQIVPMPMGAEILSVGIQGEKPVLWALANTAGVILPRVILTARTGQWIPQDMASHSRKFIGTYQIPDGSEVFVGHVFEAI